MSTERFIKNTYFMNIYFNEEDDRVREVRTMAAYRLPDNYDACYGSFSCVYEDRMIRGCGLRKSNKCVNTVLEFDDARGWVELPSMNIGRSFAGASLIQNTIVVGGGIDSDFEPLNTLEILSIEVGNIGVEWFKLNSTLPTYIGVPLLNTLQGKLVLLEGNMDSYQKSTDMTDYYNTESEMNIKERLTNRVWEGSWVGQLRAETKITWKQAPSLKFKRWDFFSVVVDDRLYVFGGASDGLDRIDIYDGSKWESGQTFNMMLSTKNAQAVVDKRKRIIVTTNFNGIVVYNTIRKTIEICEEHSLEKYLGEQRLWYCATTN